VNHKVLLLVTSGQLFLSGKLDKALLNDCVLFLNTIVQELNETYMYVQSITF
jgi:hypothetical protein